MTGARDPDVDNAPMPAHLPQSAMERLDTHPIRPLGTPRANPPHGPKLMRT